MVTAALFVASLAVPAILQDTAIQTHKADTGVQIERRPLTKVMRTSKPSSWQQILKQRLPLLGHRNWVCVVDSAYPWQNSPGIELVDTGSDHVTVLKAVLAALGKAPHVRPEIFLDKEIDFVPDADAKGISALRKRLFAALPKSGVEKKLHEEIIADLDKAGGTFKVLMLKTTLTLPYTSVFMRLNCGYWSDGAEKRMRGKMGG
ncbi:MAG: hypothetical protein HZC36_01125 [Armatimonadetes bacterium]|nr:hypothetical protein [Armatimonadota bacterium]